jgi:hypothetical protein
MRREALGGALLALGAERQLVALRARLAALQAAPDAPSGGD